MKPKKSSQQKKTSSKIPLSKVLVSDQGIIDPNRKPIEKIHYINITMGKGSKIVNSFNSNSNIISNSTDILLELQKMTKKFEALEEKINQLEKQNNELSNALILIQDNRKRTYKRLSTSKPMNLSGKDNKQLTTTKTLIKKEK